MNHLKDQPVALVRCETYEASALDASLAEAFRLSGGVDVEGKRVLLKPNILRDAPPEKGITTNPEFLRAVIRLIKAKGAASVAVGDSPGFQKPGFKGELCGLREAAISEGAEWVNFASDKIILPAPNGKSVKEFRVTKELSDADVLISLPKLKTHQLMYFTGAVKNLFGLVPSLLKSPYHMLFPDREGFASMIVDLLEAVKPAFAIMDGVIGMEGPGPGNGTPRKIGAVLASRNLPSLDIVASGIIGYPALDVPTTREAVSRGLCPDSTAGIIIVGESPASFLIKDFKLIRKTENGNLFRDIVSPGLRKRVKDSFGLKPVFLNGPCVRCGECIKICPAKALRFEGKDRRVKVDYRLCVRCFCCHEVCPEDAIEVRRKIAP